MRIENQNNEFKLIWKNDYLKSICAFANARGGTLFIGLDDNGEVVGIDNYKKLLEDLPNKIRDILGLFPQINHREENGENYLEILVNASKNPVSYHGHIYYRSGSTVQDLSGGALEHFLLAKRGKKWDGIVDERFTVNDLSTNAFDIFRKKAKRSKRVPNEDLNENNERLLELLKLTENKLLLRAAYLSFGKDAERLITGAFVKIGYFRTHSDLMYQDVIEGSLIEQVEKTIDLLTTKYMRANIAYEGITRTETYDYPEKALREAVLNAVIHKDYTSCVPIQISVYARWMMIYNCGKLPEGWTIETLKKKHNSMPANPDIARVFYRAGYIENWGRGIRDMVRYCTDAGLPEPFYRDMGTGYAIVFEQEKDTADFSFDYSEEKILQENNQENKMSGNASGKMSGKTSGKIIDMISQNNDITIPELAEKIGITERSIERNIEKLKQKGLLKRIGSAKGGHWEVVANA